MFEIIKYKKFPSYLFLDKTINFLKKGDFKSAKTKKLVNTNLFKAKLNYEVLNENLTLFEHGNKILNKLKVIIKG